jgi:predicted dehydrogenase
MVRVGVIGTGFGHRVVTPVYRATDGMEVVDVVSPRDDAAVTGLCRRTDVDLISIHSPPFLHADHVRRALAGGRPAVLCDKPFGLRASESEQLLAEAEAAGALHFVNFEFRHDPARLRLRDLMGDDVRHLSWVHHTAGSTRPLRPHGWLFERQRGGGWVGAWGSHAVDTVRWLLGEVDLPSVAAVLRTDVPMRPGADGRLVRGDAEDGLVAHLVTESGTTVSLDSTFAAPAPSTPTITAVTGDAVIRAVGDRSFTVHTADGTRTEKLGDPPVPGDRHHAGMAAWAVALRDAVRDRHQIAPSFADGLACDRVLDRLRAGLVISAPAK